MRKCLTAAFLLGLACLQYAQQFSYSKVLEIASPNRIELQNIEDFVRLARDNRVKDIFVNDTYFLFSLNSYLYQHKSDRYRTLEDYLAGARAKYPDGRLYYVAVDNRLKSPDEAAYFDSEYFLGGDDYRKAQALGYVGKAANEKVKTVYGLMRKKELDGNSKALSWVCYVLSHPGPFVPDEGFVPAADSARAQDWGKSRVERITEDISLLNIKIEDGPRSILAKKPEQVGKKDFAKSDALLFYLARLAKYEAYGEYAVRNRDETLTVKGSKEILDSLKMSSVAELQQAIAGQYPNGDEYRLGLSYGLKTKADYEVNKAFIAKLEDLRAKYKLNGNEEVFIVYRLVSMAPNSPISIDKFVERANSDLGSDLQLKALHARSINSRAVEDLLGTNKALAKIITFSPETKIIVLK